MHRIIPHLSSGLKASVLRKQATAEAEGESVPGVLVLDDRGQVVQYTEAAEDTFGPLAHLSPRTDRATSGPQGRDDGHHRTVEAPGTGAAEALRERTGSATGFATLREHYERHLETLRAQLDAKTLMPAWSEGRAMSPEQAVEYALEGDEASSA